nr:dihydrolipoyllysine-residue succinyltransferase [Gammaproteobacteria bacterium]
MNVLMPQLGETVAEGTVSVWHKQVGDTVEKNDILLDVETDKAAVEVPAPEAGVVSEIRVEAGQTVDVGAVLAVIAVAGEADVAAEEPVAAAPEAPVAPSGPTLVPSPATASSESGAAAVERSSRLKLSPVVRRLIAENGLDPHAIQGTGRDGRITRGDVLSLVASSEEPTVTVAAPNVEPTAAASPAPAVAQIRPSTADIPGERIEFDRIRRLTAEHMVRSKATSPHVLQAIEVDFSAVDVARGAAKERWRRERGFSLTYMPFISRAVCLAIKEFPRINSSVEGDGLVVHKDVNLAIAVALDLEGLVAPVIFNAGDLTVSGLAQQIFEISRKAREHKL